MKLNSLFRKPKEKKSKNEIKSAPIQNVAEQPKKKKITIPRIINPISAVKEKYEEELRRRREEKERQQRQTIILCAVMLAISFGGFGLLSLSSRQHSEPASTVALATTETETIAPTSDPTPKFTSTPIPSSEPDDEPENAQVYEENAQQTKTAEPEPTPEGTVEPAPTPEPNPYHKLDKMSLSVRTDYSHSSDYTVIQGNGETFCVTINTGSKDATVDDVIMYYDDSEIQIISKDYLSEGLTYPLVEYHCQAIKTGRFTIEVASTYDDFEYQQNGKEFSVYSIPIEKLDSRDGQVVYISYSGEKYHKSSNHAGDSWQKTTLWDAESLGIEPCGTCY